MYRYGTTAKSRLDRSTEVSRTFIRSTKLYQNIIIMYIRIRSTKISNKGITKAGEDEQD
jgi:hypothetical protein